MTEAVTNYAAKATIAIHDDTWDGADAHTGEEWDIETFNQTSDKMSDLANHQFTSVGDALVDLIPSSEVIHWDF